MPTPLCSPMHSYPDFHMGVCIIFALQPTYLFAQNSWADPFLATLKLWGLYIFTVCPLYCKLKWSWSTNTTNSFLNSQTKMSSQQPINQVQSFALIPLAYQRGLTVLQYSHNYKLREWNGSNCGGWQEGLKICSHSLFSLFYLIEVYFRIVFHS
jgi:hypothetical protein